MTKQSTAEERIRELMTASPGLPKEESLCLTGNEYLSLPEIGPDGEIASLNVLHRGSRGLLEFRGSKDSPCSPPHLQLMAQRRCRGKALPGAIITTGWCTSNFAPAAAISWKEISLPRRGTAAAVTGCA